MEYKIVETKERVIADLEKVADENRRLASEHDCVLINLMGSPGAGKTSVLLQLIALLKDRYNIGVMEADVDSDVDAKTISETGVRVIQLHSGGLCHMDADMTARGINEIGIEGLDVLFLENIGNLVCPAEFEIGADIRLMILSVPEGDDKPLKYPLMFSISDILLVNKTDTLPIFDFDMELLKKRVNALNANIRIFEVSAKKGLGFEAVADVISCRIEEKRKNHENH